MKGYFTLNLMQTAGKNYKIEEAISERTTNLNRIIH